MAIRFSKEKAQRVKQETINRDGAVTSQAIEIQSPGKFQFVRCRGNSLEDLILAHTCKIFDPDGEEAQYIIQCENKQKLEKIYELCDYKVSTKYLAPMIDNFGTEFLWTVSCSMNGKQQGFHISGNKALELSQEKWCRILWGGKRGWITRTPVNQEKFKEPQFSNLTDEEIINIACHNRVITDTDHEALQRHQGA